MSLFKTLSDLAVPVISIFGLLALLGFLLYQAFFFTDVTYNEHFEVQVKSHFVSRGEIFINGKFKLSNGDSKDFGYSLFSYIKNGDSIIKHAFSDTLYINRNYKTEVFISLFMKFHPDENKQF